MTAYTVDLRRVLDLTDDQFYELCRANPEIKFERNRRGDLVIMSPTGGETGNRNSEILIEFGLWNRQTGLGKLFDSSTGFKLPNGSIRSPDIAWIRQEGWDSLTPEQKEKFPPIAPDFVLKLMSNSDSLTELQAKMQEYCDSGVRLGWLIDRQSRQVEVYRPGAAIDRLDHPTSLSDAAVLPGFELAMQMVW